MTITTSKHLAEALGSEWHSANGTAEWAELKLTETWDVMKNKHGYWWAESRSTWDPCASGLTPRAAVLALADRLEAEARTLRESVKEGP